MVTPYRNMIKTYISPLLMYVGMHINDNWVVCYGDQSSPRIDGRYIYIPKDGAEMYELKDNLTLLPFDPFRVKDHMLVLSNFVLTHMSNLIREEDDEVEYTPDGVLVNIVELVKRAPTLDDKLPSTFRGSIYEVWLHKGKGEEKTTTVLAKAVDEDADDIMCIYLVTMRAIERMTPNTKLPDASRIKRNISEIMDIKDEEFKLRAQSSNDTVNVVAIGTVDNADNINDINDMKDNIINSKSASTMYATPDAVKTYESMLDELEDDPFNMGYL